MQNHGITGIASIISVNALLLTNIGHALVIVLQIIVLFLTIIHLSKKLKNKNENQS